MNLLIFILERAIKNENDDTTSAENSGRIKVEIGETLARNSRKVSPKVSLPSDAAKAPFATPGSNPCTANAETTYHEWQQ